jgi:hypothetical protein
LSEPKDGLGIGPRTPTCTVEDLLGVRFGGADGRGHLGFAATATDFGADVFNAVPPRS